MDLQLVNDGTERYYLKGKSKIFGENYSLMGFKNNMAVLAPHQDAVKSHIKIIRKLPSAINLSKLEVDETGDRFIQVNGQKLKVVPQGRIPEEVRKRTILLKQHMLNIGGNLKTPLPIRVISSTAQINNADTLQLVKTISADKPINIKALKKIKLVTAKLQKPAISKPDIPTPTSVLNSQSVNPTTAPVRILNQPNKCETQPDPAVDCLLPVANKQTKLLSQKTLKILNEVKMQALNLSMKKIEQEQITAEVGIQTEQCNSEKAFSDQMVQTDTQYNVYDNFDLLDIMDIRDFDGLSDLSMDSPVLAANINLGTGPSIGKILKPDSAGKDIQSVKYIPTSNMGNYSANNNDDTTLKKRMIFFKDLRECLTNNDSGNLLIHEGVINNNVGLVKRHCTALKARKVGVNLENHNGCTPLQLAIIHNAHVDIAQSLLDAEADIREVDGEGNNILHLGAKFKRSKILEVIMFHKSFSYNFDCINSFNFEGLTPLMICCIASWTAGALLFIDHGANVNLKDQTSGRTALFHAAEAQNVDIVRLLLNHKADPKIKNFFGTSPHDAMYELEDMSDSIKSLIFGRSKKRTIEAEMNPVRTAKAAKSLRTFSRLQKIENKDGVPISTATIRYRMNRQIK